MFGEKLKQQLQKNVMGIEILEKNSELLKLFEKNNSNEFYKIAKNFLFYSFLVNYGSLKK